MKNTRTLLFVGAHPDDETFGIGGTLAQYAAAGVKVYYGCATRGEAGVTDPEHLKGYATFGDMRWAELQCAARVLGLAGVIHLGYRDSGMSGTEDNKHPEALAAAPLEQVAGRIVKLIRQLKPEVVITFDPLGGYRHPDHIAIHKATVVAFQAAGDAKEYPEAGPAFQPQKLYFSVFPRRMLKVMVKLAPLFGQDPHHFGRNKDIDLASVAGISFPVNAVVRIQKQSVQTRDRAMACHASQLGGRPARAGLFGLSRRLSGQRDSYMRGYPPPDNHRRETDLFEGTD
ncbi:MAG: PIG-L family deacetylase [Chloroflexota bacterium]